MLDDALIDRLRYPIGRFEVPAAVSTDDRVCWIGQIAEAPASLRTAIAGLSPAQLEMPYRPGGWTVRQVVHHVPDSHLNAYVRFKLALTEDEPTVKPYDENRWSQLGDVHALGPEASLDLLDALHRRWVALLRTLDASDYRRTFRHPEHGRAIPLDEALAHYAWHGRHHVAHITSLRAREGWFGRP